MDRGLAGAFLAAGLVDRLVAYVSPVLLGGGPAALADSGIRTLADAHRLTIEDVSMIGGDVRIRAVSMRSPSAGAKIGP